MGPITVGEENSTVTSADDMAGLATSLLLVVAVVLLATTALGLGTLAGWGA